MERMHPYNPDPEVECFPGSHHCLGVTVVLVALLALAALIVAVVFLVQ